MKKTVKENLVLFLIGLTVFAGVVFVRHLITPIDLFKSSMVDIFGIDSEYGNCGGAGKSNIANDGYIYLQTRKVKANGAVYCDLKRYHAQEMAVVIWESQQDRYQELLQELENHRVTYLMVGEDEISMHDFWNEKVTTHPLSLNEAVKGTPIIRLLYTDCGRDDCLLNGPVAPFSTKKIKDYVVLREEGSAAPIGHFETELDGSVDMRRLMLGLVNRPRFETGVYKE